MGPGPPRGRTDEWRRRSALNSDLGKLAALTDVDTMSINITCVAWKGRRYASFLKMISPPFSLSLLEARIGLSPVCKISLTSLMVATRLPRNNERPKQYSMI